MQRARHTLPGFSEAQRTARFPRTSTMQSACLFPFHLYLVAIASPQQQFLSPIPSPIKRRCSQVDEQELLLEELRGKQRQRQHGKTCHAARSSGHRSLVPGAMGVPSSPASHGHACSLGSPFPSRFRRGGSKGDGRWASAVQTAAGQRQTQSGRTQVKGAARCDGHPASAEGAPNSS